jgi:hypothetical protein
MVNDSFLLVLENYSYHLLLSNIVPILPQKRLRDEKGRFTKTDFNKTELKTDLKTEIIRPFSSEILNPLVGNMLGDGHLRFTHKDINRRPKPNTNALYSMTLKNKEYIMHLWSNIFKSICTNTVPNP